jgi:hypothetical protein
VGRRRKNLHDTLRYQVDLRLVELIQHGRPVFDGNGSPVIGDDGKQMRQPPTSADLNAAIKRLKDVGHTEADTEQNQTKKIIDSMRRAGHKPTEDNNEGVAGRIPAEG